MRRGEALLPVWLAPGAVSDPRGLVRFGSLARVLIPVGPVAATTVDDPDGTGRVLAVGPGGVEHQVAPTLGVPEAIDRLRWCADRGLRSCVVVRGVHAGEAASVVGRLCRSLEGDTVGAVEVDLRHADDQSALKVMARVREAAPRDLLLLARLSALQPDLVAAARGAVAGGAGAVVVCGSVPIGAGRWWSGPSTGAVCRSGVRLLREAGEEQRWPSVPLVAAGGVHDVGSALEALAAGASAVQLGTALWRDPTILWQVLAALSSATDREHEEHR